MNLESFSHNNPQYYISDTLLSRVEKSLSKLKFNFKSGTSTQLREAILEDFARFGWSDKVVLDQSSNITITSINDSCGLCLQTGNVSRFYADILKLEFLYKKKKITAGIYIIPVKGCAKLLGSNIANYERFTKELSIFKDIVSVPLRIYGLNQ